MFKTGPLFASNYAATAQVVVNQGGTSSGKTYTILQVLFVILAQGERLVCTVVGQDIPNLKAGALRDALEIYGNSPQLQALIATYNKSDRIFTFNNGSILEFKSYEDAQDAKSGKRDYAFFNEANGIPYAVFKEVYVRTRIRTFIDYNPNAEFWVHEHLVGKPNVLFLRSWHEHNPFLSQQTRDTIEAYRLEDEELWRVYARGLTGKIEGLVLRRWRVMDEQEQIPEAAKYLGTGMDFGFTNDPTTAIDVYLAEGELWLDEVLYETGLTNPDIYARLTQYHPVRRWRVVADSAEPKSIEELRRLGLDIEPAQKGPDSINASIDTLKRYHINVTRRSVNLRKELNNYKWAMDRQTGKPTNKPVDAFNHAIDAVRYLAQARLQSPVLPLKRAKLRRVYSG